MTAADEVATAAARVRIYQEGSAQRMQAERTSPTR
jgi:hypothetical protein